MSDLGMISHMAQKFIFQIGGVGKIEAFINAHGKHFRMGLHFVAQPIAAMMEASGVTAPATKFTSDRLKTRYSDGLPVRL